MSEVKYLSVIVPVYNEEENIQPLHHGLQQSLLSYQQSYEIIYVDDGSTDATFSELQCVVREDPHAYIIQLSCNFGQTAAISAGIAHSSGKFLVLMDGDLQNDPQDIPHLLEKLDNGYDIVSGWRKRRKDASFSRRLPSWLANRLISRVTGIHLHDYGCTLKAYRREVFQHMHLYGEMHRFLPAYAALHGAKIAELEVAHYPRCFGTSKYGISRTIRVVLDLLSLKFQGSFGTKPIHGFGIPALVWLLLGFLFSLFAFGRRRYPHTASTNRLSLLSNSITCLGFGGVYIFMGLQAETMMRIYYETQGRPTYVVKTVFPLSMMVKFHKGPLRNGFERNIVEDVRELINEQEL